MIKYYIKHLDVITTRAIECKWILIQKINGQIDVLGYFKSYDHAEIFKNILKTNQANAGDRQ